MKTMLVKWVPNAIDDSWGLDPDPVVWVSVRKLEESFAAGDQYVGPGGGGCGQRSRYANIGRHFMSGFEMRMPDISLSTDHQIRFSDGRHRFAWVRDHGAAALPVNIGVADAGQLSRLFGTDLRECSVVLGP